MFSYVHAFTWLTVDQALGLELHHGEADHGLAHLVLLHQLARRRQLVAGLEHPELDPLADVAGDLVVQRCGHSTPLPTGSANVPRAQETSVTRYRLVY